MDAVVLGVWGVHLSNPSGGQHLGRGRLPPSSPPPSRSKTVSSETAAGDDSAPDGKEGTRKQPGGGEGGARRARGGGRGLVGMRVPESPVPTGQRPPGRRPRRCGALDSTARGDPRDGGSGGPGRGGRAGAVRGAETAQRSPAETPRSAGGAVAPAQGGSPGQDGAQPQPSQHHSLPAPGGSGVPAVQPDPSQHSRAAGGRGAQQPRAPCSESAAPGPCRAVRGGCSPATGSDTRVPESPRHGPHGPSWRRAGAPARAGCTYRQRAAKGRHGRGGSHAQGRCPGLPIPAAAPGTGFAPAMSKHRSAPVP